MPKDPWDKRGRGSWEFSDADFAQVVNYLMARHTGAPNAVLMRDLAQVFPGIEGRALRGILAKADGNEVVVCTGDWGVFVAEYQEDAERSAGRLRSQAMKMNERARRKSALALTLPRRQGTMLPPAPEEEDGDEPF